MTIGPTGTGKVKRVDPDLRDKVIVLGCILGIAIALSIPTKPSALTTQDALITHNKCQPVKSEPLDGIYQVLWTCDGGEMFWRSAL